MNGDYDRYVYTSYDMISVVDPREAFEDLGLESPEDSPLIGLVFVRNRPHPQNPQVPQGAMHAWVVSEEHAALIASGLIERMSEDRRRMLLAQLTGVTVPTIELPNGTGH